MLCPDSFLDLWVQADGVLLQLGNPSVGVDRCESRPRRAMLEPAVELVALDERDIGHTSKR